MELGHDCSLKVTSSAASSVTRNGNQNRTKLSTPIQVIRRYIESLPKEITMKEEVFNYQFWKAIRTEFLATLLYVLIGCGSSMYHSSLPPIKQLSYSDETIIEIKTGLAFSLGCVILMRLGSHLSKATVNHTDNRSNDDNRNILYWTSEEPSTSHTVTNGSRTAQMARTYDIPTLNQQWSANNNMPQPWSSNSNNLLTSFGIHLNPAITFSLFLTKELSLIRFFCYMGSQCLGSIIGCLILSGLTSFHNSDDQDSLSTSTTKTESLSSSISGFGFGVTVPLSNLPPANIFGFEFLGTFIVVLTYLASLKIKPATTSSSLYYSCKGQYVGIAHLCSHLFAFRYTGASFNPARSLGPAVITNKWTHHWLYWLSPMLGSMLASFTFEYIKSSKPLIQYNQQRERGPIRRDLSGLSSNETDLTTASVDGNTIRY